MKKELKHIYFDMDGVLCDWVDMYNKVYANVLQLDKFNNLNKEEKNDIKDVLFTYDFFYNMKPIKKGIELYKKALSVYGQENVSILTAYGDSKNIEDVIQAKKDWIELYLGKDVLVQYVDKVQNKKIKKLSNYDAHYLVDDRIKAIEAWVNDGGIGILFTEEDSNVEQILDDINLPFAN